MDFRFNDEENAVAELARRILEDQVTNERLKELEAAGQTVDEEVFRALAEANLLGTAIPESVGGSDLGFIALCLLLKEVGRTVAPVPVYGTLVLGALPRGREGRVAAEGRERGGAALGGARRARLDRSAAAVDAGGPHGGRLPDLR